MYTISLSSLVSSKRDVRMVSSLNLFTRLLQKEPVLFFLISLVGIVLDLGAGTAILFFSDSSTYLASVAGFFVGLVTAYVGHEKFTFYREDSRLNVRTFMKFATSSLLVIGIRLGVIFIISSMFVVTTSLWETMVLCVAAAVSFVINYVVSRKIVFKC